MNPKRLLIIGFLALVLGAFASRSVYLTFQSRTVARPKPRVSLLVAARDLQVGRNIKDKDVEVVESQTNGLPPNCFREKSIVQGRRIIVPISKGDFIQPTKLAIEDGDRFSALSSPGMRAVSLRVKETIAAADSVQPGARVNVLVIKTPRRIGAARSTVLLRNVTVIAVGSEPKSGGVGRAVRLITLLLSPHDAQKLRFAGFHGMIQLDVS